MNPTSSHFCGVPHTKLGWWSVGLGGLFTLLFISVLNEWIRFSGFLIMVMGVSAGILTLIALIWKKERSWMIWFVLLPGLFAILFSLGEILVPH